jgi:hypothetical protein
MTVQNLRDYVRNHLESDTSELPDSLLDIYRAEATDRIIQSSERWSFYETDWSFSTTSGTQAYSLASGGIVQGASSNQIDSINSISAPTLRLQPQPHELMLAQFPNSGTRGYPLFWSLHAGSIYIWPIPGAIYALTVRGYRKPVAAVLAADTIDLPSEFHPVVGSFMLMRAYQQQDDFIMAPMFTDAFERGLQVLRKRYETAHRGGIRTIGGIQRGSEIQNRLRYVWE